MSLFAAVYGLFEIAQRHGLIAQKRCRRRQLVGGLPAQPILPLLLFQHRREQPSGAAGREAPLGGGGGGDGEAGGVVGHGGGGPVFAQEVLIALLGEIEGGEIFARRAQLGLGVGKLAQDGLGLLQMTSPS